MCLLSIHWGQTVWFLCSGRERQNAFSLIIKQIWNQASAVSTHLHTYHCQYTLKRKLKVSQYRHCVQWFCKTVLIFDKSLTQHEIYLISCKCEHFQQYISKIYPFSSLKLHKGVNIKIQISKISLAPLRRFLAVYTEILVLVACLRCLRSFQAAMKRYDMLMSLWP